MERKGEWDKVGKGRYGRGEKRGDRGRHPLVLAYTPDIKFCFNKHWIGSKTERY